MGQEPDIELRRLRWQCRRGMLELDHLLSRFLDLGYGRLDADALSSLAHLLREQDQDLHRWLVSQAVPPPEHYQELVALIRRVGSESAPD